MIAEYFKLATANRRTARLPAEDMHTPARNRTQPMTKARLFALVAAADAIESPAIRMQP
jgi:hypothetical protein